LWVVVRNELVAYGLSEHEPGNPDENSTNRDDYCRSRNRLLHRRVSCHWSRIESSTFNVRFFVYQTTSSGRIAVVLFRSF
jgi:hypothetical protein